jgi:hypothetical protein
MVGFGARRSALARDGYATAPTCDLADHYDARVMMDDSHAINVALIELALRMPFAPIAEIRAGELGEAAKKHRRRCPARDPTRRRNINSTREAAVRCRRPGAFIRYAHKLNFLYFFNSSHWLAVGEYKSTFPALLSTPHDACSAGTLTGEASPSETSG